MSSEFPLPSFYYYREPGKRALAFSAAEPVKGIAVDGLSIGDFYNNPESILTIPAEREISLDDIGNWYNLYRNSIEDYNTGRLYTLPADQTSQFQHRNAILQIQKGLSSPSEKAIATTVITEDNDFDLKKTLELLSQSYPTSCIIAFYTPQSGLWVTATPELLMRTAVTDDIIKLNTVALAGTRKAGTSEPWDNKNIVEQRIVEDYIAARLSGYGFAVDLSPTHTHNAGAIEHLCTPIDATLPLKGNAVKFLSDLLPTISPTPAVCGFPREKAYTLIAETEGFSRAYYGGWAGINDGKGNMTLWVNLRCATVADRVYKFAGGGITLASDPDSEWLETRRKAAHLKFVR